jgi:hypothetical protein
MTVREAILWGAVFLISAYILLIGWRPEGRGLYTALVFFIPLGIVAWRIWKGWK